jgi:CheY-like chemotaxis protein
MALLLLIEDDHILRENTTELLEAFGYDVIAAPDGVQGLSLLEKHAPDLIICDIMMPGIDGYQVKTEINTMTAYAGTPFVFLSGKTAEYDLNYGMALGASGYVTKPYKIRDLIEHIEQYLNE